MTNQEDTYGWYRFEASNSEPSFGWCESREIAEAACAWINRYRNVNLYSCEWLCRDNSELRAALEDDALTAELLEGDGLLVTADSRLSDFAEDDEE